MARELGLDRKTVRKYARARTWQEVVRRPPHRPSTLDPYLGYLQQRWDERQHSAKILHEELLTKSYLGHYQRVKMAIAPLRRGCPWTNHANARPPRARCHAGSAPARTAAAHTPPTGCTDELSHLAKNDPTIQLIGLPRLYHGE
ncbi:hypothetical protein [Streptomyces sp. NBC_00989]|uniref:hypothetical protein n=1 Tax=Streptomyces sp. NBC_00989 TaxID=2903705 RepID=UPI0038689784|nr:hypothetical protein OG714_00750 [Streptomyces sp. NBC_00989]WSW98035.1 hypothetical protein OG714_53390 [Streptomyces sp. NBC_00989]